MARIKYTERALSLTKNELIKDILSSGEELKGTRAEIRKVLQRANRRIQNINKAGLLSPAVESLKRDTGDAFTVFSSAGKSWAELQKEYGRAVEFLNKPTSTATGARQYKTFLIDKYELSERDYDILTREYRHKQLSERETDYVENVLKKYKNFTQEIEEEAQDIAQDIEAGAAIIEDNVRQAIERAAVDALTDSRATEDGLKNAVNTLFKIDKGEI